MPDEKLQSLVHPGDVLAAVKVLQGSDANLLEYEVKKGTETVQGLMSMILRVIAKSENERGEVKECRFIVKRMPALEVQIAVANEMQLFAVEADFFRKCAPLLWKKCPDLALVRCLFTHDDVLVFEDLGEQDFRTLSPNILDLQDEMINLPLVRMILRQLAKFHAASLDIDWKKVSPQCFEKDVMFEVNGGEMMKQMLVNSISNSVVPIMKHLYPKEKIESYVDYLSGPKFWDKCVSFVKFNNSHTNVVCQGDFWLNNVMLRLDPEGVQPLDLRIIDMQTVRLAPQCTDLQYFLYLTTKAAFRNEHEEDLLRTYWEAFTAAANRTPDPVSWPHFLKNYRDTRLFGTFFGLTMLPILFAGEIAPEAGEDGEELTAEQFKNIMGGGNAAWDPVATFETNEVFRDEMQSLIEECIREMDLNKVV